MKTIMHYQINPQAVSHVLVQQKLKKWWVAEFSGVHRTTFQRWLSGKTRFVLRKNAENLAKILQVPLNDIARPICRKSFRFSKIDLLPKA